jgi:hypothetical protein
VLVQTNLLHDIGDIELSKHQVLESSCNAPELGGILYQRPKVRSKLHLDVDWSHARLAISHGRTLNDVLCVSVLVKKQPIWTTLDDDAEELVKRAEVFHGKFPL